MWRVIFSKKFRKMLNKKCPQNVIDRVFEFAKLQEEYGPFPSHFDIRYLGRVKIPGYGELPVYRLRIGDSRISFAVSKERKQIIYLHACFREDFYTP